VKRLLKNRSFRTTDAITDKPITAINEEKYTEFSNFLPIDEANKDSIVYCSLTGSTSHSLIRNTRARIILSHIDMFNKFEKELCGIDKTILFYEDPRLVYVKILNKCLRSDVKATTDDTAKIDPDAKLGENLSIGPLSIIGKCDIGSNSTVGASTIIHDGTKIGKNVKIGSSCDIGSEGFGFVKDENGKWIRFPHIGGVVIEDEVEVFPFCDIGRGTLGDTIIRRGTKMSFQVHIAHNCVIGENCMLTAGARVAGSAKLGENCVLGNGSIVRDKVVVGKNVRIGAGAVVVKDVPDNVTVVGNPARELESHVQYQEHVEKRTK
jgi:UDP-3-O-[3-hydroxymyristoyl] glucosamine N-acyltransferase